MLWLAIVLALLFIIILLICILRVSLFFAYIYSDEEHMLLFQAEILGIPVYMKVLEPPEDNAQQDFLDYIDAILHFLQQSKSGSARYQKLLKKITIVDFTWKTHVGAGDAPLSGISGGSIWTIKGMAVALMQRHVRFLKPPIYEVHTDFHKQLFESELHCMGKVGLGQAMRAFLSSKK